MSIQSPPLQSDVSRLRNLVKTSSHTTQVPYTDCSADTEHIFEGRENDWGFTSFAALSDLLSPEKGFLQDGALHLKVTIEVEHPDNYLYNSKKKTGFVGLKNQGATCYLNSLLQTLYNINYFRKVSFQSLKRLAHRFGAESAQTVPKRISSHHM